MNINEIIAKKQNSEILTKEEIKYFVNDYVNNKITDENMTLLLKAICKNGMEDEETYNLTIEMLNSGDKIDLSTIEGIKIDKHSTGGVGDKITLIVLPIVASLGIKCPKMSGKALGHTGGTIDKLESIGINVNLSFEKFVDIVNKNNMAIVSQMGNLVPADKKIYALRDLTDTTKSIPLIASSIMSKKLASGADKIVLDVKVGKGAFYEDIKSARKLATLMVKIGKFNNKETVAILTNMDSPLGNNIGNSLEVVEALEVLNSIGNEDLTEMAVNIAAIMVMIGKNISLKEAKQEVLENIKNREALKYFYQFINLQEGNLANIKVSEKVLTINSTKEGYINVIDAKSLGMISMNLGAGRKSQEDSIDYTVGLRLRKHIGDQIKKGEPLIDVFYNKIKPEPEEIINSYIIGPEARPKEKLIYELIK